MASHNRGVYCAPETSILEMRLENIVATSSTTDMPESPNLVVIEGGIPFGDFGEQIW